MLVLAYLGLLALVPLLTEKDDKEVQWHAKHGLVQFFAWIIVFVLFSILLVHPRCWLRDEHHLALPVDPDLIVTILSIMKAVNGQRFLIPGLSDFADKF